MKVRNRIEKIMSYYRTKRTLPDGRWQILRGGSRSRASAIRHAYKIQQKSPWGGIIIIFDETERETFRLYTHKQISNPQKPGYQPINKGINFGLPIDKIFYYTILVIFLSNLFSSVILIASHPNMEMVIGNPKTMYMFSIDPSCKEHENDILSALDSLSKDSGIKFVRIQSLAPILGGIEYSCSGVKNNPGAIGESESGSTGWSIFVFTWNQIRLQNAWITPELILHETLHSLGFGHNNDRNSIMYSIISGTNRGVDQDIINFIRIYYTNNPLGYVNLITVNMLTLILLSFLGLTILFR